MIFSYFSLKNPGCGPGSRAAAVWRGAVRCRVRGEIVGRQAMLSAPGWPMFRTRGEEVSGWEAALPAEVLRLPEELARADALLDDPVFFAPFAPFFDPRLVGRRRRWRPTCG